MSKARTVVAGPWISEIACYGGSTWRTSTREMEEGILFLPAMRSERRRSRVVELLQIDPIDPFLVPVRTR